MRRIGKRCSLIILVVLATCWMNTARAQAKPEDRGSRSYQMPVYVASSEAPIFMLAGVGLGVPYGVLGGCIGVGTDHLGFQGGVGVIPLIWESGFSISGTLYAMNRVSTIRPKITLSYSNAVGVIAILEEGSLDPLYSKTYEGLAAYGGVDWRLGRTSPFGVDLNIGMIFPTVGIDEMKDDFDNIKADYESRGYRLDDLSEPRSFPFVSLGLTFCPARAMRLVMPSMN